MGVKLEQCNADIMLQAISDLGLRPVLANGIISFGSNEYINTKTGESRLAFNRTANEIKQAYSRAIVQRTSKRFGWTVKQSANQNQLQILKR